MGLDSVEIVMCWEETFEIFISDDEAAGLRTPRQAIELISSKLGVIDAPSFCPTLRAFHLFQATVRKTTSNANQRIKLTDTLRSLQGDFDKAVFWESFQIISGIKKFRPPFFLFRRANVRDVVKALVARHLSKLSNPRGVWTRPLVRFGVRSGITEIMGTKSFSDDDRFIEDIGVC